MIEHFRLTISIDLAAVLYGRLQAKQDLRQLNLLVVGHGSPAVITSDIFLTRFNQTLANLIVGSNKLLSPRQLFLTLSGHRSVNRTTIYDKAGFLNKIIRFLRLLYKYSNI